MDFDGALPVDKKFKKQVDNDQDFVKVADLCISLGSLLATTIEDPATSNEIGRKTEALQSFFPDRSIAAQNKKDAYDQAVALRNARFEELTLPKDGGGAVDFSTREIRDTVGPLNDSNKQHIKQFFLKLTSYGEAANFSHTNYKTALVACLEGSLLEDYELMADKSFPVIAEYLYKVYHKPISLNAYEEKLLHFTRFKGETIDVFMLRYGTLAAKADEMLPAELKKYQREDHKLEILKLAAREPAKSIYFTRAKCVRHVGYYSRFESALGVIEDEERGHDCLPKFDFKIHFQGNSGTEAVNYIEANPAVLKRKLNNKRYAKPYSVGDLSNAKTLITPGATPVRLDPLRATSQKAAYYNSRDAKKNNQKQIAPFVSKADKRKAVFIDNQKGNQNDSRNRSFKRAKRNNDNCGQSNSNWRGQQRNNNFNQGYKSKNNPQVRHSSGHQNTTQKRNFGNQGYKKQPAIDNYPGKYAQSFGRNYKHKNVSPRLYCDRCGVDRNTNKAPGTDHTTSTCPHDIECNAHNCSYCLKHIEAKHFAKFCLQAPPNYKD